MESTIKLPEKQVFEREEILTILQDYYIYPKKTPPNQMNLLREIKEIIEEGFSVNLMENTRKRHKVNALKAFCYLARKHTNVSSKSIGEFIQKDHATILHHSRSEIYSCLSIMQSDKHFAYMVRECERKIVELIIEG